MRQFLLFLTLTCSLCFCVSQTAYMPATLKEVSLLESSVNKKIKITKEILDFFNIEYEDTFDGIVKATNTHFLRKKGQERWQMPPIKVEDEKKLLDLIHKMGLIEEIKPKHKHYKYVFLMGSTTDTFRQRLFYLAHLYNQGITFDHIDVLSGNRSLDPAIESKESVLNPQNCALSLNDKRFSMPKDENEMVKLVMQQHHLPKGMEKIPIQYIPVTMFERRPNTDDTIKAWAKLKKEKGSILVISNQPFVEYQELVARLHLSPYYQVEAVGPKRNEHNIEIYLDQIARVLYNLKHNINKNRSQLKIKSFLSQTNTENQ